jgi:hypothetical protein
VNKAIEKLEDARMNHEEKKLKLESALASHERLLQSFVQIKGMKRVSKIIATEGRYVVEKSEFQTLAPLVDGSETSSKSSDEEIFEPA